MIYIIGIFILLFAVFLVGYVIKKKYFKEMDRLEAWKIDLFNRPILDEMAKVKQLNMIGQTEKLFEDWRNQWDDVVTVKLPSLEDMLFDAEEYIDRYKFRKAKATQQEIEKKLLETENQIKNILEELHELVGSEEKNRIEMEQLKEIYRETKKMLLAHRLTFGNAEKQLEAQLDDVTNKFREFAEKTEQGDYLEAREVVLTIHAQLTSIKNKMDLIPQLLIECQSIIPSQLSEVQEGYREMEGQGYYLDHLELEKEITQLEENLKNYHALIEENDVDQAGEGIKEVKERIDILFDLLEKEVLAKHFVLKNEKITSDLLTEATKENENLSNEVTHVQQSYQLTDSDFEIQRNLERELSTVYKHYSILVEKLKMNETAQSAISEEVRDLKDQLDAIRDEQQSFALKLQALRKDELEAREKVKELTKKVGQALRLVTKSNIPGLPNDYKYLVEDAKDSIQNVKYQLEENPLTISALNQYLEIAVLTVEKLTNTTIELVENVMLAEKAIQYGNRYRSQYPSVAKGLLEAERAFRQFDYQEAIEQAATSIERIDPEALKKIKATVAE
ncbi:septation ring formation regulator EzrA [Neobacillus massiliamazoniensis]|uniref:Septation ring formation regulator EzrA n=1 Tax=Neobacillus massiliamazoniensis TaxID=1499688 RepID=A0A0U1P285_9BACI|nr:septation ring formation regulator EzrA [Neobacillus massiliamazoniensis]CRK84424.1 Septation ring formation regulator EzrA [Neobacillus massiliamazoniensis]